jgi:replicative DNA helicase
MSEETFAYTEEYQAKVLAYMMRSSQFCTLASEVLEPEHFCNKALQWYFTNISTAAPRLTSVTLKEELIRAAKGKSLKEDEIPKFVEVYDTLQMPIPIEEEEHLRLSMNRFVRTQSVKRAIIDSLDLIDKGDWDQIVDVVSEAASTGLDVLSVGHDYFADFEDRLSRRDQAELSRKLATGVPSLDEILYGGIKNKQLGLIAGGTGRGKSIFLEWLARVAILLGKKVVYYTLELSEDDVADRFDSLFAHVRPGDLKQQYSQVFTEVSTYAHKFGSSLIIKEYPADSATVNSLSTHFRQLCSMGIHPDLVIVDYLDLLKPHRTYNSSHEELDAITKALHGMSKDLNTRIWTATQLNRAGIVMETPDETAIAGALSKLFTVDIALFLAQTTEEREDEIMRIFVAKNRNGPAGRTVKIDTDYSFMTFYKPPPVDDDAV